MLAGSRNRAHYHSWFEHDAKINTSSLYVRSGWDYFTSDDEFYSIIDKPAADARIKVKGAVGMYLTHDEMAHVVREASRVVRPGGTVLFTQFVEPRAKHRASILAPLRRSKWPSITRDHGSHALQKPVALYKFSKATTIGAREEARRVQVGREADETMSGSSERALHPAGRALGLVRGRPCKCSIDITNFNQPVAR